MNSWHENLITLIFDTVGDVLFYLKVEEENKFIFQSVNDAFLKATGLVHSQVIGKSVDTVIPEPSLSLVLTKYHEAIKSKKRVRWDEESTYPSGVKFGEVAATPIFNGEQCVGIVGTVHDVTERVLVEKKLHESEEKYRKIIENSEEGVWIIDEKSKTTIVNQKMADMFGYTIEEMMGKDMFYFIAPERHAEARNNLARRKLGVKEQHDFIFDKKDGTKIWTTMATSPLVDEMGNYVGALAMVSDVTRRRRNEALLEAQRNVFELLVKGEPLESALSALVLAIERIVDGVIASVLLMHEDGLHLLTGSAPHLPDSYNQAINGAPIGPVAGSCGTSAFTKKLVIVEDIQNDPLWVDYKHLAEAHGLLACWSSPILSKDGTVLGTFALYFNTIRRPNESDLQLIKDATAGAALSIEHVKAHKSLAKLLQLEQSAHMNALFLAESGKVLASSLDYKMTLKNVAELIVSHFADWCFVCMTDSDGFLTSIAVSAEQSRKDLILKLENYRPDMNALEGLPKAIRTGKPLLHVDIQDHQLEPDESGWTIVGTKNPKILSIFKALNLKSYMAIPMFVRNRPVGGLFIASARNEHQFNDKDLELAMELSRSCAMAIDNAGLYLTSQQTIKAREEFIAIASHELRTPLTSLKGRVDLLIRMIDKGVSPQEMMTKIKPIVRGIQPEINRFTSFISALLDVAAIGQNRLVLHNERIDLSRLVEDQLNKLKEEFSNQNCKVKVSLEDDVVGKWDPMRIEQVITNLLNNAMKFGKNSLIEVFVAKQNGKAVLRVTDHGIGIPASDQERIFNRFERAVSEKNFGGMGLGLYITKQIVLEHKGRILVESEPGKGASFIVELPLG